MAEPRPMYTRLDTWAPSTRTSSVLCFAISLLRMRRESSTRRASMMDSKSLKKLIKRSRVRFWRRVDSMQRPRLPSARLRRSRLPTKHIQRRVPPPSHTLATPRSTRWLRQTHRSKTWTRPATISSLEVSRIGTDLTANQLFSSGPLMLIKTAALMMMIFLNKFLHLIFMELREKLRCLSLLF